MLSKAADGPAVCNWLACLAQKAEAQNGFHGPKDSIHRNWTPKQETGSKPFRLSFCSSSLRKSSFLNSALVQSASSCLRFSSVRVFFNPCHRVRVSTEGHRMATNIDEFDRLVKRTGIFPCEDLSAGREHYGAVDACLGTHWSHWQSSSDADFPVNCFCRSDQRHSDASA